MRRLTSERARWAFVVAGALVGLVAIQLAWLIANRRGYPLSIDEAGYIAIALKDHSALANDGVGGFWNAIEAQAPHAPLVPALTALLYTVHTGILISFGVVLGFLVLLVGAVYGIAERLASPRAAALAAAVTATLPGALEFSRVYIFALPTAALLTSAVYAVLRSDGLRSTRWSVTAGVAMGLMLLTRTMAVAFLPGLALATAVAVVGRDRGDRRRSLLNGGLALVALVAVAATWYLPNLNAVVDYLTGYGYGDQSHDYGRHVSAFALGRWTAVAEKTAVESIHLPSAVALIAGLSCAVGVALRRLRGPDGRVAAVQLLRSEASLLAIVLIIGYLALSTSSNPGWGFGLPLVPLVVVLAIGGFSRVPALRAVSTAVLIVVALLNVAVAFNVSSTVSRPHFAAIPLFHGVPVTDGRPLPVSVIRQQEPGSALHFTRAERQWIVVDRTIAGYALAYARARGTAPILAFATRHRVTNTNSVDLAGELWFDQSIPMAQLTVDHGGDTSSAYARFLSDPKYGQPNFLVTSSTAAGDYTPHVTQARAEAAARQLGFRPVWKTRLPDGRDFRLWWLKR
jgi:4-amino-4-deoxy-L-arabinose transferase-like glycosyltransferase